ncbi:adenosine deaminase [Streptoalloteichus hindustanus]|uniref:Aminodeoxyfutalosine deaminase n=1 Tax=Streptoalloteichus hindustanus TaxID=2017 RepID=A0A1M5B763_STRHI|nr:adenosine deaminase [Streptoalloteichus hindustanus]SHF38147.1 aminodeoxyfutalosine deaminase [Streptoalloteichus hindustanus]
MPTDVPSFVDALPKVELHVHLVGSASVDTVLTLARRHADGPPRALAVPTDPERLRAFYEFTDFAHFIEVILAVGELVTTGEDVTTLVVGLARDLASRRVRYSEVTVTPVNHLLAGVDQDELAEALAVGRRRAAEEHGVELAWIFDIPGEKGPKAGLDTVDWVLRHRPEGTVGFGLGGPEDGFPRELFREAFDRARAAGLRSLPHAGETTGPETVWSALRDLGAERIGHGINAVDDPRLLDHLAEHGIPLEVCPTSNVRTRAVRSLAEHPLPRLLAAGVPVTLATDDPGMFDTDLNREYLLCHTEFGMSPAELAELSRAGVRAAFCDEATRTRLLTEIDEVAAGA